MRKADIEITQYGLLTALATIGQANQKQLSAGFAIDSTTLTRTMAVIEKQGWVKVVRGEDRRERLFSLTPSGKRKLAQAAPHWEAAEGRLRKALGEQEWKAMHETVGRVTQATSSQPE